MIKELIEVGCLNNNILEPNSIAILEYLKSKDKSLAILTSGFRKTQIERIILSGLYDYFDDIYTGEEVIKPLPLSYKLASGSYPVEECIMIGNNLEKDVYGPSYMGMKSIYYNKDNNDNFDKKKILSINDLKELKERY
jgi:putative hydrolase of the HAD superfamily